MTADNFLGLTNRVLRPINEVELSQSNFLTAQGIYADARDSVNKALHDIYTHKDAVWPFLFSELTFSTIRGIINYTKAAGVSKIDWNSFSLKRPEVAVSSLTRSGTTVTVNTSANHEFLTGDNIEIIGAVPTDYNVTAANITVTSVTQFTFTVGDDTLTTPATGTITVKSNTLRTKALTFVDKDEYKKAWASNVENTTALGYAEPKYVSRLPNNNFIIFYPSDRVYNCSYSGYSIPARLSAYSDTHLIPEEYEAAITDLALHYIYMFRDNIEQAAIAKDRADRVLNKMVRTLSPFSDNMVTP